MDTTRFDTLLAATVRLGATALHLVPGRAPALRVQRRFVEGDDTPVQPDDIEELTSNMLFSDHREQLDHRGYVEVLYVSRAGGRYRATVSRTNGETSLVLCPVPMEAPQLASLDLPDQISAFTRCRQGFVVVGGFFGAGKSTTLSAIVDACSRDSDRHIVTIEDSIQVLHQNGASLLHQREVGRHVATAAEGVRQAVAFGADVIVVSEIHDLATLDAVLTASESGCLVFAGVEAGSIIGVLVEMTSLAAVEDRSRMRTRLARSLRGVTAQSLLNRSHKGGRVPVVEVLVASPAVRTAIRTGRLKDLPAIMRRCRGLGMQTTDIALRNLLNQHLVLEEEALLHASDREEVLLRYPVR
jgi:twitching motility protein PilT